MKNTYQIIAALSAGAAFIAGLDFAAIIDFVPDPVKPYILLIPTGAAMIVHLLKVIKDNIKTLSDQSKLPLLILPFLTLFACTPVPATYIVSKAEVEYRSIIDQDLVELPASEVEAYDRSGRLIDYSVPSGQPYVDQILPILIQVSK